MPLRRDGDEGLSLVEVIVGMAIATTALLGLLGELASYIHQQTFQKAHTTAVRLATSELEDARRMTIQGLRQLPASPPPQTVPRNGVDYEKTTTIELCKVGSGPTCDPAAPGDDAVARVKVNVAWTDARGKHQVALRSTAADASGTRPGSTSGLVTDASGVSGTSVVVSSMSVSPSATAVNASGHPLSAVVVSLQAVGLSADTTIPVTWTDDTGGHQATMTGDGSTWSVSLPASSITDVAGQGATDGSVTFAATVPGVETLPKAVLTVLGSPSFTGACSVTPAPITLAPLTRSTTLTEVVSCTTSGLVASDRVRASYASGTGTATLTLVSTDGSHWTGTIVTGTPMAPSGSSESFTFALTRESDGATANSSLTVPLS